MNGSPGEFHGGQEPNRAVVLDGDDLRKAFEVATHCLERQRDGINALNVFPVPDGDTGTNMLLTMRSVNEESFQAPGSSAGAVMDAMAHGALLGARGNSGVILSQFFYGLAQGLRGKDQFNGDDLAQALMLASRAAYSSVSKPVDGTMLTVIRELSLAASRYVESRGGFSDARCVWRAALEAAKEALAKTPLQLSVLREAGVVDAGGQGIVTLLEGACCYLAGDNVDDLTLELCVPYSPGESSGDVSMIVASGQLEGLPAVQEEYLAAIEDELYGYCTQLLIEGQGLDVDRIRKELSAMAESTVVVGDDSLVKVHAHVHDPGPVISYAVSLGMIGQVSIDNIDQQHREFAAIHRGQPQTLDAPSDDVSAMPKRVATAVVAVVWGEGFVRLFQGLGCETVVTGGQTMNPSTQELLNAARDTGAMEVILLPNNPKIVPAARQAASIADGCVGQPSEGVEGSAQGLKLHVVPSCTIPQGVAALLAFNPEAPLDGNLKSMEGALTMVSTIEVTRAVRPATLGGLAVEEGQYIGLVEGKLVAAADSALSALEQALSKAMTIEGSHLKSSRHELLTLYSGGEVQEAQATAAAEQLKESVPGVEVEVVYGGQPYYHYIASLE